MMTAEAACAALLGCLPLLCFAYGARRIALSTVGFLQYLGPTCMFALGVFVYGERLSLTYLTAFVLIWAGLAVYSWDSVRHRAAPGGAPSAGAATVPD